MIQVLDLQEIELDAQDKGFVEAPHTDGSGVSDGC